MVQEQRWEILGSCMAKMLHNRKTVQVTLCRNDIITCLFQFVLKSILMSVLLASSQTYFTQTSQEDLISIGTKH